MYQGHLDNRHHDDDPNHLGKANRERTPYEDKLIDGLAQAERFVRDFLSALPNDCDPRSKAQALIKLDELVLWARKSIDR